MGRPGCLDGAFRVAGCPVGRFGAAPVRQLEAFARSGAMIHLAMTDLTARRLTDALRALRPPGRRRPGPAAVAEFGDTGSPLICDLTVSPECHVLSNGPAGKSEVYSLVSAYCRGGSVPGRGRRMSARRLGVS